MTDPGTHGIYLIYDGECPMCSRAAFALRVKKAHGDLHLVEARQNLDHPVVKQVTELKLDLDEGMVLYDGVEFYHGKDALKIMARYGDASNLTSSALKSLYWSDLLARATYPILRAIRNRLLVSKQVGRIDNLKAKNEPIFKPIFGESWDELPPVLQKHYANRPYCDHSSVVEGKLDVMCAGPVKWLAPVLWILKGIPPQNERDVGVTVKFKSEPGSNAFHFDRNFNFSNRKPYRFRSRMVQTNGNEVVEIMASGLGWRMNVVWQDNRVKLKHSGYVFHILGFFMPLPLTLLLGAGNAEEVAVDEYRFDMSVEITHPLWGKVYGYNGRFKTSDAPG